MLFAQVARTVHFFGAFVVRRNRGVEYQDPADYGVPELPNWAVSKTENGGPALSATADTEPFIRADQPVSVRR